MAFPTQNTTEEFFDFLYEDTRGFVYSATKNPVTGEWLQYFFEWPSQRQELIEHVRDKSSSYEVYTAPSLYRRREATKEAWLGTHVLWAEFDYGAPTEVELNRLGIPSVSYRVRSSTDTHEHWYWKLGEFEVSGDALESITRRIAYNLHADLGTWNRNRVLRPPNTIHHESGRSVATLARTSARTSVGEFGSLREPPSAATLDVIDDLPEVMECIAHYHWTENAFNTFRSNDIPTGERSDRLCWLAYECATMGMGNAEILSVLLNVDERWKKFFGRDDRLDQLLAIVGRARLKFPAPAAFSEGRLPVMGSADFVAQDIQIEWVIEGLLPKESLWVLVSPPAVGKTQLTLQLAIHMALGRSFLGFEITRPMRTIFFSLEMPEDNLHYFMKKMFAPYDENELKLLNDNLKVVPLGYSIRFDNIAEQTRLLDIMDEYRPDGIMIDSLGTNVSNIDDTPAIINLLDFYKKQIMRRYGCFVGLIHHFRKGQVGNKKPSSLYDLFGSQYIGSTCDLVLSLWKDNPADRNEPIAVNALKPRMGIGFDEFFITRTEDLSFELVEETPTGALSDTSSGGENGSRLSL